MAKPPRLSGREIHKRLKKAGFAYESKRGAGAHAVFYWPEGIEVPKGMANPIVTSFTNSGKDADLTGVRQCLDAVEEVNKQRPKGANKRLNPNLEVELMAPLGPGPKPLPKRRRPPPVPVVMRPKRKPKPPTKEVPGMSVPSTPATTPVDTNVIIDLEPAGLALLVRIEDILRAAADPHDLGVAVTIDRQHLLKRALVQGLTAIQARLSPAKPVT